MTRNHRTRSLRLLVACLLPACAWAATGDGSPQDSNLLYVGRWDRTDPAAPHSYWGGAYVRTGFTGTSLSVKLGQSASLAVFVDSKAVSIKTDVTGTVSLATGLASGNHTVKLVARYQSDEIVFQGFVLDAGAKTLSAEKSAGLVEFIGNSISSGTTTTNGNVSAFPWLVGESLGADRTAISFPGITLVNGYYYSFTGSPTVGQEVQYTKTVTPPLYPSKAVSTNNWDFTRYTPDLVVVNLGTNDKNASVPSATFQTSYVNFLKFIRGKFPKAHIFGMRTYGGYFATETESAVNQVIGAGDKRVHYVNTTGWLVSGDYSSDGIHPTDAGQVKVASKLATLLKPYLDSATTGIEAAPAPTARSTTPVRLSKHLSPSVRPDGRNMTKAGVSAGREKVQVEPEH